VHKSTLLVPIVAMFAALSPSTAIAVENGKSAAGDPNAVAISGYASGFLYSPRMVFTAAHVATAPGPSLYIELPGATKNGGKETIKVQKVLVAPTYKDRTSDKVSRIDDFAILILEKPVPMKNHVVVASQSQLNQFIDQGVKASLVGYGFQSAQQRSDFQGKPLVINPAIMETKFIPKTEVENILAKSLLKFMTYTYLDAGFSQVPGSASICDNDSGAGFFVQDGADRIYIGAVGGLVWGIPNCGQQSGWDPNGAVAMVTGAFRFSDLIKEAETFVASDSASKNSVSPSPTPSQTTAITSSPTVKTVKISCSNGKTKKYVVGINPSCPPGYKKTK